MPRLGLRLSLRARLYLVCGALIVILLGPAYYTLRQLGELRDIAFDLRSEHAVALQGVGRLEVALADLNRLLTLYVTSGDLRARDEMQSSLDVARLHIGQLSRSAYAEAAKDSYARVDSLTDFVSRLDSLVEAGDGRAAAAAYTMDRFLFERTHRSLSSLAEEIDTRSTAAATRAETISERTARTTAAATGLAAGLAVLVALLFVGTVTSPLTQLRSAMSAVAGGKFAAPRDLPYDRSDEIGDLTRSFRSMAERLSELDRLKAEFVSIASHELKTPLNVVGGYVELLEDESYGPIDPRQREAFTYIREQTDVLRERVDQLLSLSRLEAQGLEVKPEPTSIAELFEELRRNFAGVAAQHRIVFSVTTEPSTPRAVMLDPRRVRDELLGNLLGNAFKFTPKGGTIDMRARGEGGWLVIEIRDTGAGIPSSELPYIFEKYYQAGQHAGKVGAGLGLAIAREIVDAHGGLISVESERGIGSTFRIELPAGTPGSNTIDAATRFRPPLNSDAEATVGRRA